MTDAINFPISSIANNTTAPQGPTNEMDKEAFLKLLVAQLKYQDPMNPTDAQQFMSQTAQFTQVEKLEEISEQNKSNIRTQGLTTASALIGRKVKYQDASGAAASGVVTGASLSDDGVTLKVSGKDADLTSVIEVEGTTP